MSDIQPNVEVKFGGKFKLQKVKFADEGIFNQVVSEETDWVNNLLLDSFLDFVLTNASGSPALQCAVGTGQTAPTVSDTSLESQVGSRAYAQNYNVGILFESSSSPKLSSRTYTFNFPLGSTTGNLAEIGLFKESPIQLITRSLIKDDNGDPITFTVLEDEALRVLYKLYILIPETPVEQVVGDYTFSILPVAAQRSGSSVNEVWNPVKIIGLQFNAEFRNQASLSGIDDVPTGTRVAQERVDISPYIPGTFEQVRSVTLSPEAGTIGFNYINLLENCQYQMTISPAVSKSSTQRLNFSYKIKAARA